VTSLARREREALCDLALELGPGAPTAPGRSVEDLVAHLLLIERHPYGVAGLTQPRFAKYTRRSRAGERERGFPEMVERLRHPGLTPWLLPFDARRLTTLELVVAHEDMRRAGKEWKPRTTTQADDNALWRRLRLSSRRLVRQVGIPRDVSVVLERSDPPKSRMRVRPGQGPLVIRAKPLELVYLLHGGRRHYNVLITGPEWVMDRIRQAEILTLRWY